MRGKRAKQIRRASGLVPKIYKQVRDAAMAEGKFDEIYLAVPAQNQRLWDGKGGRLDQFGEHLPKKRSGKKRKYTPPAVAMWDQDVGLFSFFVPTQMFTIRNVPDLPMRLYRNAKRVYDREVRAGRRAEAIAVLQQMDPS